MSIWFALIGFALVTFGVAAYFLDLPRQLWAVFGTALTLGMAGYALQGSPSQPGAPASLAVEQSPNDAAMVDARRAMFNAARPPSRYVTISDGFARKGQFADAAGLLKGAVEANPQDGEAWLAMALALTEHANGKVGPAALEAFSRAIEAQPDHPAPGYFLGVAFLRSGEPLRTRAIWAEMLERTPPDAPWRDDLEMRLTRLDELLEAANNAEAAASQP